MKDIKVGIDTTRFSGTNTSSHEQVLVNLLKGFYEIGVGESIQILCHEDRYDYYKRIIPNTFFVRIPTFIINEGDISLHKKVIRKLKREYNTIITNRAISKFSKRGIDVLLFSTKRTIKKKLDIPTIFIPHDIQNIIFPERWCDGDWVRKDFELRDIAICISDFDKSEMVSYLPEYEDKIRKIYNPIAYRSDVFTGIRESIVCLNVNVPHKNCITILKAYNRIKDFVNEKLVIMGYFTNKVCLDYIVKNHLEGYVEITGYITEEELSENLRKAKLYVSASTYEGFGMTPVEAIIQGVPTIVYKGTASFETTQGLATYFDSATDDEELAQKMLEVLNKPLDIQELERKSKTLQQTYDYKNIAKQYWNLFTEMSEKTKGGICKSKG